MKPQKASSFRHWIRLHGFDWWQVFGSACLVMGVLGFAVLMVHVRPNLPRTNGAFLLQTVIGGESWASDSPQADPSPSSSPAPDLTGLSLSATVPHPSASRSGVQSVRPSASPPPSGGVVSPTPSVSVFPTTTPSPTPRPSLPQPSVSPTATPRPCIHC